MMRKRAEISKTQQFDWAEKIADEILTGSRSTATGSSCSNLDGWGEGGCVNFVGLREGATAVVKVNVVEVAIVGGPLSGSFGENVLGVLSKTSLGVLSKTSLGVLSRTSSNDDSTYGLALTPVACFDGAGVGLGGWIGEFAQSVLVSFGSKH